MSSTGRGLAIALGLAAALAAFALGRLTAPARPPAARLDLADAILVSLGEGDALDRLGGTATLLEGLGPENLPSVLAVYEQLIPSIDPADLRAFFSAWARFDPADALEYALAWPRREMMDQRRIGVRAALAGWAYADPPTARAAAEEAAEKHPTLRAEIWVGLVSGWVRSDQGAEGLTAFLADLRPRPQRDAAADVAARELVRTGGADAALDWADSILGDESQEPGFKRAVFNASVPAAAAHDPARTGAWALGRAEEDYAADSLPIAVSRWGRADGAAAMGWLGAAGEPRDEWVREAFRAWSNADWESAEAWLESTPATALRDPALEVWAERLLAWEPAEALGACERILDPERRQRCLASGASRWYAKDALAAEAWLQTSSLDEAARSQVRRAPDQPAPRRRRNRR